MVQLVLDLQKAIGVFLQIDALMQDRDVQNDFVDRPVIWPDMDIDHTIQVTIRGGHKHAEEPMIMIQWSCGIFLDEGSVVEEGDPDESYHAFVEVEILKRDEGIHYTTMFDVRHVIEAQETTWALQSPSLKEMLTIIEELGSLELKERLLATRDINRLDHQFTMDLISTLLPLVGATAHSADRPAPTTQPSPGSALPKKKG